MMRSPIRAEERSTMRKRRCGGVPLVMAAFLLAATGCKQSTPEKSQASAAAVPEKILIGATLPLTGIEARIGGFYKEGYDLAFEEWNKQGGLEVGGKKRKLNLLLLDDTSAQATAASLADRLINSDKVDVLLGTYATNLVEAQCVVAEQNEIPYVNGGGAA